MPTAVYIDQIQVNKNETNIKINKSHLYKKLLHT